MSLSGTPLLALAVLVALAVTAATVATWPRLGGRTPQHVAGRVGLLLVQNLTLVLAASIAMNDTFEFFSDWADLGGALSGSGVSASGATAGGGPTSRADGARASGGPAASVARAAAGITGVLTGRSGDVLTYHLAGGPSRVSADVYVDVPPDYARQVRTGHRFPVIEAFSGYPSNPRQWLHVMGLVQSLADLARAHQIAEPLIVMPTVELPPGTDTECVDGGPAGPQVERWVAGDVPAWVRAHLPVTADAAGWASIGLSTGGFCAAMVAMHHPDTYGAALSFAGYYQPEFSAGYQPFAPGSAAGRRYDLVRLAEQKPPPVAMWALTSRVDPVSYPSTQALTRAAHAPFALHTETLQNAGHRTAVLKPFVPAALRWLAATLPGFAPGP